MRADPSVRVAGRAEAESKRPKRGSAHRLLFRRPGLVLSRELPELLSPGRVPRGWAEC